MYEFSNIMLWHIRPRQSTKLYEFIGNFIVKTRTKPNSSSFIFEVVAITVTPEIRINIRLARPGPARTRTTARVVGSTSYFGGHCASFFTVPRQCGRVIEHICGSRPDCNPMGDKKYIIQFLSTSSKILLGIFQERRILSNIIAW